jgi:hypothetical protein
MVECVSNVMTTTAHDTVAIDAAPFSDNAPYGWRFSERRLPDGRILVERVSLTLEDVLHSQEGDEATDSDVHQRICIYLYNARARSCHIHVFRAPSRPACRRAV